MRAVIIAALAIPLLTGPAWAEDADCATHKWSVDRETTAFRAEPLPIVASGAALPGPGEAATLTLVPQVQVTYPAPPRRTPKHKPAYGGTLALTAVATTGIYQVTISDDAWIDVVQNGKALRQVGFTAAHGCKPVGKSVRFSLATGPATVEISDAATDTLKIDVLPKEP